MAVHKISPDTCLFVVIDVQGKLAGLVQDAEKCVKNIGILIQGMKILDVPIIATEQYPQGLGHTVDEVLQHLTNVPMFTKDSFSCCGELAFTHELSDYSRSDVVLCGIETHVCVYQTARDLLALGYNVHVVADAVSSRTDANRALGLRKIEQMGGAVTGTETVLFELLGRSGTEKFKAISKLVR